MINGIEKNKTGGFSFFMYLPDNADPAKSKTDPTIIAEDIQIKLDGGAFGDLTNLPAVDNAGESAVPIILTQAEINADRITVQAIRVSDTEWNESNVVLTTVVKTADTISTELVTPAADAKLARQALINKLELSAAGVLVLFDDAGASALKTWATTDVSGGTVTVAAGLPAKRPVAT